MRTVATREDRAALLDRARAVRREADKIKRELSRYDLDLQQLAHRQTSLATAIGLLIDEIERIDPIPGPAD